MKEDAARNVMDSLHRINNKLTGIMGITELLLRDWGIRDDEEKKRIMRMVNETAMEIGKESWVIWNEVARYDEKHFRN